MTKLSVVLPTYRRPEALRKAIEDVLAQTMPDFELLVMDDGSEEATQAVVKSFHDSRVKYVDIGHFGIPGIVIEGFRRCASPYFMVVHDHDRYDPTLFEKLAKALDDHPTATYAHCGVHILESESDAIKATYVPAYPPLSTGADFLANDLLPGLASPVTALTMVRRDACDGRYLDPAFGACSDVELWMRLSARGDVAFVAEALMSLRQRDARSHFFHSGHQLLTWVVNAKKKYLSHGGSPRRQAALLRQWRREIDVTCLGYLTTALEHGRPQDIPGIVALAQKEGTRAGAWRVKAAAAMPRGPTLGALRAARWTRRRLRAMAGIRGA